MPTKKKVTKKKVATRKFRSVEDVEKQIDSLMAIRDEMLGRTPATGLDPQISEEKLADVIPLRPDAPSPLAAVADHLVPQLCRLLDEVAPMLKRGFEASVVGAEDAHLFSKSRALLDVARACTEKTEDLERKALEAAIKILTE